MKLLFRNARLVLTPSEGVVEGSLLVKDGVISRIDLSSPSSLPVEPESQNDGIVTVIDCRGDYLAPGLVDIHCHGAVGRDTMEATPQAFAGILDYHASRGTTTALLTTVAASREEMLAVLLAAEEYRLGESRLAGIHLEGPYFSPARRGAHRVSMLRHPTPGETRVLMDHAALIRRMTLAPELPGALELVGELIRHGIAASIGHSDATDDEARAGFGAGISQVTHLYNCMSSLHTSGSNRLSGVAEAALTTSGILCEVIADGVHLSPTLLRLAWLAKGWEGVVLVSDATAGAGLGEGASFELGCLSCRIENGVAWTESAEGNCRRLAGSTASVIDGVRVMVERGGVPLGEAVAMGSLVPARSLGMETSIGSIAIGKKADLFCFSDDWRVHSVWSAGKQIG